MNNLFKIIHLIIIMKTLGGKDYPVHIPTER